MTSPTVTLTPTMRVTAPKGLFMSPFKTELQSTGGTSDREDVRPSGHNATERRFSYRQALNALHSSFNRSKPMLEWADNWDDEGSPAIRQSTWDRMQQLLERALLSAWHISGTIPPQPPIIAPGPDGSIDVHWQFAGRELLLNIPVSTEEHAAFYGDNERGEKVKGELDIDSDQRWLLEWLTK